MVAAGLNPKKDTRKFFGFFVCFFEVPALQFLQLTQPTAKAANL